MPVASSVAVYCPSFVTKQIRFLACRSRYGIRCTTARHGLANAGSLASSDPCVCPFLGVLRCEALEGVLTLNNR